MLVEPVLVNYLEVNFAEIAEQLAAVRAPGSENDAHPRAASAERLRQVIRRLRQATQKRSVETAALENLLEETGVDLSEEERRVFEHFFERFERSIELTRKSGGRAPDGERPAQPVATAVESLHGLPPSVEPFSERTLSPGPAPESTPVTSKQLAEPAEGQPAEFPLPQESAVGPLQTILVACAQQSLDLLQVDASELYSVTESGRFVLRAAVPTDQGHLAEPRHPFQGTLLSRTVEQNEVLNIEDLAGEELAPEEQRWLEAGYRGLSAVALSPPLERPSAVLVLLRRSPWRLDRKDAVRLEDLALEAVTALRPNSLAVKVEEVAGAQERIRLAREIHDGLASDLAALVALFKYYEQRREKDPDEAARILEPLRSMAEEILAGARNVLQSLRPKTIRSEGLRAALLKLVERFGRFNQVETTVSLKGEEGALRFDEKEVIFQVLREALSNVRKHAQAGRVSVTLDLESNPWLLMVEDDGRGFEPRWDDGELERPGSYGLIGMRERAEMLDGTLEVTSGPGSGTTVVLKGPAGELP
jgi:signal transduction histidine kinase